MNGQEKMESIITMLSVIDTDSIYGIRQTISVPTEKGKTMREKLIELVRDSINWYPGIARVVGENGTKKIADRLIADGVIIPVRCKDCKHCDTFYPRKEIGKEPEQSWYCKPYKHTCKPDGFCSDGERRE